MSAQLLLSHSDLGGCLGQQLALVAVCFFSDVDSQRFGQEYENSPSILAPTLRLELLTLPDLAQAVTFVRCVSSLMEHDKDKSHSVRLLYSPDHLTLRLV